MNPFAEIMRSGRQLTYRESYAMQHGILSGSLGTEELVHIFEAMDGRYPTIVEMNGIIAATKDTMIKVDLNSDALDMVGTGGDGMRTFNISTVAAIICSACGVPVAKHGNRSATSRCGSADVLEALGVNIMLDAAQAASCFRETGMVFLYAPSFHPALKNAAQARKQYGKRTYFNILGPLVNPAGVSHLTLGVFDTQIGSLMGKAAIENGARHVYIVHSPDGLDEISPFSHADILHFSSSHAEGKSLEPGYRLQKGNMKDIQAVDAKESAGIIMALLRNEATVIQKETALINAAAGILTFGKAADFGEAMNMAAEVVESGRALQKLNCLIEVSNE
ncbi:MAG: anthranilate phosphoribosyltransferase [Bacteroidia bacterium]|nr:anthranilate phosphoribosyltransferase [Bacteroidia bacterium]